MSREPEIPGRELKVPQEIRWDYSAREVFRIWESNGEYYVADRGYVVKENMEGVFEELTDSIARIVIDRILRTDDLYPKEKAAKLICARFNSAISSIPEIDNDGDSNPESTKIEG